MRASRPARSSEQGAAGDDARHEAADDDARHEAAGADARHETAGNVLRRWTEVESAALRPCSGAICRQSLV